MTQATWNGTANSESDAPTTPIEGNRYSPTGSFRLDLLDERRRLALQAPDSAGTMNTVGIPAMVRA